tara:strand:- start:307 stop:468 length:162 start_codon:yes stop_codon:yes gene_type:complete
MKQRLPEIIYKPEHLSHEDSSHEGSRPNKVSAAVHDKKNQQKKLLVKCGGNLQ